MIIELGLEVSQLKRLFELDIELSSFTITATRSYMLIILTNYAN